MTIQALTLPSIGHPILTLNNVTKTYGETRAASNVTLSIPRGSIYGFLGPNGAGKTTTIRSIMKIVLPDSGEILFAGKPVSKEHRDRIGYLPEERGLYRKMKCVDQLAYLAELKGVSRKEAIRRADTWLEKLDLADWRNSKVDALSKGMQQKIQFAATLIFEPDLVILDEVFSGLDPLNIELIRGMILAEREKGTTILFSTHMLAEAEKICDSICLIEGGEVIIDGTMDEVRKNFPLSSIRVAYKNGKKPSTEIKGVLRKEWNEGSWRMTLAEGIEPSSLLPELLAAGELSLFSANRPTLNEIFLEAVSRRRGEVLS
jgi:ABC-2 type transport system ATP-binding protein